MTLELFNLTLLGAWIAVIVFGYYFLYCKSETCTIASYIGDIVIVVYSACITYFLLENLCVLTLYKVFVVAIVSHFTGRMFFIILRQVKSRGENEPRE